MYVVFICDACLHVATSSALPTPPTSTWPPARHLPCTEEGGESATSSAQAGSGGWRRRGKTPRGQRAMKDRDAVRARVQAAALMARGCGMWPPPILLFAQC